MDLEKAYDTIDQPDMWQMKSVWRLRKSVESSAKFLCS